MLARFHWGCEVWLERGERSQLWERETKRRGEEEREERLFVSSMM
jgi:hypothetical protein